MDGILLIVAIALLVPVLLYGLRGGRAARVFVAAGTTLFALWFGFLIVSMTDYRDADGWADCADACSTLQATTGSVLVFGLVALALVAALSVLAAVAGRLRTAGRQGPPADGPSW